MKTRLIKLFSIISIMLLTAGCGKKEMVNINVFSAILNNNGFNIIDLSEQYQTNSKIENVLVAKNNNYQVEFFVLSDIISAQDLYNKNLNNIQNARLSIDRQTKLEGDNYLKSTITANNYYFVLSQVDNTFVYIVAPSNNQEEIDDILKELNY